MSDSIAASPPVDDSTTPSPSTHAVAAKGSLVATVIAAVIGFCTWATVFGLKNAGILEYVSAKQKELIANPVLAPNPGSAEWEAALGVARDTDSPVTGAIVFATLGVLMALGSLLYLWGVGGVRPKGAIRWIAGMILIALLAAVVGYLAESLFIASRLWLVPGMDEKRSISMEARFMAAEGALWAGIGIALATFAILAYGKPGPIWKAWPGIVLMSALGGVIASCIAMAITLNVESLSPLTKVTEIGAVLGLGNAILCATLAWKATS